MSDATLSPGVQRQSMHPSAAGCIGVFTVLWPLLAGIAVYFLAMRFIYGLGAVTNISNGYTWGIWVVWDVIIATGLACGGYAMALVVYILNRGEFHPLVRSALTASVFGYTLGGVSVLIDLGRYWNFWHILSPAYFNTGSVMFEVAACITLYVVVLWIEFVPTFLEYLGRHGLRTGFQPDPVSVHRPRRPPSQHASKLARLDAGRDGLSDPSAMADAAPAAAVPADGSVHGLRRRHLRSHAGGGGLWPRHSR